MTGKQIASKLPSQWLPIHSIKGMREELPLTVPRDAWVRIVAHDSRGLPFLIYEVFWITPDVIHFVRCEGWILDDELADGTDERAVLSHERISLETVEGYHVGFTPTGMKDDYWVELTGGIRRTDLPVFLIGSHLDGGSAGYGPTKPPRAGRQQPLPLRVALSSDDDMLQVGA